ncbi:hypothetical protein Tco_1463138 [Tanacetum coccineum]
MKLFKIGTSRRKGLDKENASKQGRKSDKTKPMLKDSNFDVLDDAVENVKDGSIAEQITTAGDILNTAGINISVVGPSIKEPRKATPIPIVQSQDKGKGKMGEPEPTPKNPRKAQIQMDEELAQRMDVDELLAARLQEQEREQFSVDEHARFLVETIAARKKFFAAQRAAEIITKHHQTQLRKTRCITYMKQQNGQVHHKSAEEQDGKKDDSSSKQAESSKKRPRVEHDEESVKKQKLQDDAKKEKLRAYLVIVQGDDIAIDVESLATKYPIVDWKTHILTKNMMYYQIIRADGSSKNYKIFSKMLDDFDRQDVMDLHS